MNPCEEETDLVLKKKADKKKTMSDSKKETIKEKNFKKGGVVWFETAKTGYWPGVIMDRDSHYYRVVSLDPRSRLDKPVRCLIEDLKSFGLNVEEETKFAKKGKSKENKQFFREALKDAAVICKTNKKVKNH